jgi:hypothetical protein
MVWAYLLGGIVTRSYLTQILGDGRQGWVAWPNVQYRKSGIEEGVSP